MNRTQRNVVNICQMSEKDVIILIFKVFMSAIRGFTEVNLLAL